MNIRIHALLSLFFILSFNSFGQMSVNGQILFGNEWIDYNKTYYKIKVAEDGLYRIDYKTLDDAGFFNDGKRPEGIALLNFGKQLSIYVSTNAELTNDDYILFYGTRNRSDLDTFLYEGRYNELLNPDISLFSDTNVYYLVYDLDVAKAPRINLINPDYTNTNLPVSKYYWHTENHNFFNTHHKPVLNNDNVRLSYFWKSEGFVKAFSTTSIDTFQCSNVYKDENLKTSLQLTMSTNSNNVNNKDIYFNDNFLARDETRINNVARLQYEISTNDLKQSNLVRINGENSSQNHGLANAKIIYPREYEFEDNKTYEVATTDQYFNLGDFKINDQLVFEINSNSLFKTNVKNNNTELLINNTNPKRILVQSLPLNIRHVDKINFTNYSTKNVEYLIVSSKKLYNSEGGENDVISEYKNYRSSVEGGGYKTEVIFDDEIYDQYSYGVINHPFAFKNMTQQLLKSWKNWEYVFLLGKGREYNSVRTNEQLISLSNESFYLPTYGISPSDLLLFTPGISLKSELCIGRLANADMNEAKAYLEKIKTRDAALKNNTSNSWLKNIMHLGGGGELGEKQQIKTYLRRMEEIIETPMYGANVSTYYKENDAQTQIVNLPKIKEDINNGLSIINFFGHAAVGTFDFSLDEPANYGNEGKLPFMFSLGCYSGNICTSIKGVSEKFVLIRDKGAVGSIAASGSAYLNRQGDLGLKFYTLLNNEFYGESVGKIFKKINRDFDSLINNNYFSLNLIAQTSLHQQMVLHSDPALVISGFDKPDYRINSQSVATNPIELTIEKDSFDLIFTIDNIGKAIDDSFNIMIQHILPDQKVATEQILRVIAPFYTSTSKVKLRLNGFNALGLNKIKIKIDYNNEIDEFNENNNEIANGNNENYFSFYVLSNSIETQYPCEFAILNKTHKFELRANTINILSNKKNYIVQIDTTKYFNSPLFRQKEFVDSYGNIVWTPEINLENNITYYWRVAEMVNDNSLISWAESSFTYLEDSPEGWTQRHIYQYEKNKLTNIIPRTNGQLTFSEIEQLISVRSQVYIDENNVPSTIVNGAKWGSLTPFRGNADVLNVLVWTKNAIWKNITRTDYGSLNHSNNIFSFDISNENGRKGLKELSDDIPDSAYVFMFVYIKSINSTFNYSKWNEDQNTLGYTIYTTMQNFGATEFDKIKERGVVPYIYIYRKGFGKINELISENKIEQQSSSLSVNSISFFGMMSANVGPASKWNYFNWDYNHEVGPDTINRNYIHIYKVDKNSNEVLHKYRNEDGIFDLSNINANEYPELRIEFECVDWEDFIPGVMHNWKVIYEGFPDIYLASNQTLPDTIDQGELLKVQVNTGLINKENVNNVNYIFKLINSNNEFKESIVSLPELKVDVEQTITINFDTKDINGDYQFVASANYDMNIPEKVLINNNGLKSIYIKPDRINPLLNVTFDGINILDGDIVSPTPIIEMNIKDENKYLLLDNNSLLKLELLNQESNEREVIEITDNRLEITQPADTNDNNLKIKFKPELVDGDYSLYIQSKDKSNNNSGKLEYNVNFKVISKKAITNFVNYPNPFSTSTQFIFDLTGKIPENLRIQIMTISGKIVKEISKEELGSLRIGTNRTTFKWNGTDEYGSKLANGVYLYRILITDEFEASNLGNYKVGKLVIMR